MIKKDNFVEIGKKLYESIIFDKRILYYTISKESHCIYNLKVIKCCLR